MIPPGAYGSRRLAERRDQQEGEGDGVEGRVGDHPGSQPPVAVAEVAEDERRWEEDERRQRAFVEDVGEAEDQGRDEDGRSGTRPAG